MFVLGNCVHTFSLSSKEIYCFVGRNGKIKRTCYSYMSGTQSENTTSFRAVTQTLVNLRNRTGEERRRQTLCDKRDNNFV